MSLGKSAFGNLNNGFLLSQSDYITKKTRNVKNKKCENKLDVLTDKIQANKYSIIAGLYVPTDLSGVCVVKDTTKIMNSCNAVIDPSSQTPFYYYNTIDPYGSLFGASTCGVNGYKNYMTFTF